MFGKNSNPLAAYAEAGISAKVKAASPHRLILLLFEGAASAIAIARLHIEQNEIEQKGKRISQAIDIISNGLKVSLDMEAGGTLAAQLAALYDYMCRRLITANIGNNLVALDEVARLLDEIHSAWKEIGPKVEAPDA